MKTIFFILGLVFMVGTALAVQPARKPFVLFKIDGTTLKTGDILTVANGQKLQLEVDWEGGRKDYCKFPETYFDVDKTAKILSHSENGIAYELNGKKAEWKLLSETTLLTGDENIQINSSKNQTKADLIPSSKNKIFQTFIKAVIKSNWQFSQEGITRQEENVAEGIIYFTTNTSGGLWFQRQNVKASGAKDKTIEEKLILVQNACDSIEHNMYHLNLQVVQQNIRTLQSSINDLKSAIDAAKLNNPDFKINVTFIGLPSDRPGSDIASINAIKNSWLTLGLFLNEQKQAIEKLTPEATTNNKNELAQLISGYSDWQSKLPEKTFELLNRYIPDIRTDSLIVPPKIVLFEQSKTDTDYLNTLNDFKAFLDHRINKYSTENQKITTTNNRIQAIRLFDGMLRSYFNSISWAEWINTQE